MSTRTKRVKAPGRPKVARWGRASLALAVGFGVAGCNWTKFADEAEKAPVRSIGAPSGFDSSDFGKSILPLSSGQGSAAAFVATSINESHMVLVKIGRDGKVSSSTVTSGQLIDTDGSAITSLAEVPGSAPTRLLLGTPIVKNQSYGQTYTFDLPDPAVVAANPGMSAAGTFAATKIFAPPLTSTTSGMARGLAAGNVAGGAQADYIVGSDDSLAVMVDGPATAAAPAVVASTSVDACEITYDNQQENRYLTRRPMLAAQLWNDQQQIVLGITRSSGGAGKVEFLNVTAGAIKCLAVETPATAKPQFGHALVTGDFDGNGKLDLLVGAPPQQAFVYLNFADRALGTVPAPIEISLPGSVDFGYAVAALNVDGVGGDEILISDPRASVGGQVAAGHVLVYHLDPSTGAIGLPSEIADLAPEANASFGYTVNALPFCSGDCPGTAPPGRLLLVGAANEVFLYYRVGEIPTQMGVAATDARSP